MCLAVQPYAEYITKEELNAWCKEANEQYEKDIQELISRIGSHRPKNLERVVYDHEGNEIGIETELGELILITPSLETIMDDVQITVTEGEAQVPPPGKFSNLDCGTDDLYTNSMQDHNVPFDSLHLFCEDDFSQESQIEPRTKMEVLVPTSDLQGVKQLRLGVYEFSWDDSEDDTMQVSQETLESETIMDIKVPPPVQQDIEQKFWGPTPWNIDDVFWSDEEDVIEEEELIEIPKTPTDDECFEEGLVGLFETEDDSEDEFLVDMIEEEEVPSWEDELVDLPTPSEESFDPLGDLKLLEDLLYQRPSVGIEEEVHVIELESDPPQCTQEREK
ncbi:hypothetical protein L1987_57443 [Smallanthus sonchifolius]|uniref:Uncharacterized protein n=1 Tax=Smallanthus sonchifolius TaxID=185202 RepID=A0ACB9DCL8_9ASTR|nr:hypothetical protein L1987_57443 [Smallanthus sonchifolius]